MPAFLFAFGMTAVIAIIILALSMNVLFNHNTVPIKSSSTAASDPPAAASASGSLSVQQLQALVQQYQSRESQYQTELQQAASQINTLNQQNQQYQNLINALQQAGVIRVDSNGNVYLGGGFGDNR